VQLDDNDDHLYYTYPEITGGGSFSTHHGGGDTLYGADIGVHPGYRGRGVAGLLYIQRRKLMQRYNLRRMLAYGRIPGYKVHAGRLTADEYVKEVVQGHLKDSALNAHLKAGYRVKKVVIDFVNDRSSLNYATLLEMANPRFDQARRQIAAPALRTPVRRIRVCAAQFEMRRIQTWEDFERNVEFFIDTADTYHSHFLVFPELFTCNLFSTMEPGLSDMDAMRKLAAMEKQYIALMSECAKEHGLYIVGGSTPVLRGEKMYNVAHLFTPTGGVHTQDKLHITPGEREYWDFEPGEKLRLFKTPYGRVGILLCYDIEFPELARLLTLHGVEVIFVPFSTDERKAFNRVRICAQARAVENYIYTVTAGNVGNLPNVRSYLINYGQAAVYTPSDFAFPLEAIAAQADPNAETVVIADLDLSTLKMMREVGTVRPLYDLRPDLYRVVGQIPVEVVQVE